jgi:hypothetical protein
MGTIEKILTELAKLFQPLASRIEDKQVDLLMAELGLKLPASANENAPFQEALSSVGVNIQATSSLVVELIKAVEEENTTTILSKSIEIAVKIKTLTDNFSIIGNGLKNDIGAGTIGISPAELDSFISNLPKNLFEFLVISNIENNLPALGSVLELFKVIDRTEITAGGNAALPAYTKRTLNLGELGNTFTNPSKQFSTHYDWGKSTFNGTKFFSAISKILINAGIPALYDGVNTPSQLNLIFANIGVDNSGTNPGIFIEPSIEARYLPGFTITENGWEIKLGFLPNLGTNAKVSIFPDGQIKTVAPSFTGGTVSAEFNAGFTDRPFDIVTFPGGSKIDAQSFGLKIKNEINASGIGKTNFEANLNKFHILITLSDGDSFISKITAGINIDAEFNLRFGYSTESGVFIEGSGTIEIMLPAHIALGPIDISGITISVGLGKDAIPLTVFADFKASLGPLEVVVENIGVTLLTKFLNDNTGNFGRIQVDPKFKPPNGLGLSINAGAVIGGGYLFFDFEKEEYAGVLELTIAGFISAKAIGLITTKMPDGSKGFSMLIIITAEFMPAFQLGYGFTLIGVGGLLGLNRTVLLDPLRDAVRTGAVTSIMFPQNVVANAPRIISDLKAIFPPYEGKFLIGPMAKLGWGTPTLISLSLGLIIEIPGNFAILGVLKIALPEERIPLVQIQVLFVGTIDFDKKMLTFDASLYESFILTMTIEGDMAVRLKWGDNPDFLLSVGGFHPSYTPPPLALPTMRRLAINILNTDIARIRVECYSAITSNTVQFGARADIMFDLSVCSITGFISFDALFQFSPFYFIIEVAAGFSLKAAGIDLLSVRVRMSLEGPTPWRARGTGSVSILFFEISADFDVTWGEEKNTALPDIAILQTFIDEVKKKEMWSTVLSTGKNLLVSLRKFDNVAEAALLVMHPAGSLVVQQKLLPLKVNFDKIGNQKTSDVQKIEITTATSSGEPLTIIDVDENFARAQYQNLSDAEKLSKPSFERMPGGVSLTMGANTIKNGKLVRKKVKYETTIIDKEPVKPKKGLFFGQIGILFANFLKGNSVSKSVLSKNYSEKLQPFNEKMDVLQEGYTVAFQANNKAYTTGATFTSEMMAQTFMQDQIAKNPSLQKEVHIILKSELQTS